MTSEYAFIGNCGVDDCSGDGIGVLTLKDYTLGTGITDGEFVSFSYSSNLTHFTIDSSDLSSITGVLPIDLPAHATVDIVGTVHNVIFISEAIGDWCTGANCLADEGANSIWRTGGVPEPST